MGRRGPAPKPTAVRRLEGNASKRPINDREPEPDARRPRRPAWLSYAGARIWSYYAPRLHDAGLLVTIDRDLFAMFCQYVGRYIEAEQEIAQRGMVYETANGNLIQSPYVSISNRSHNAALRLAREFGLTPSSRSRIVIGDGGKQETDDLLGDLFKLVG